MSKHVAALGFLHLVLGALSVLGGLLLMIFGVGSGLIGWLSGDDGLRLGLGIAGMLGSAIGVVAVFGGLLGVLTGFGLLARRGWGRVLGIVSSVLWLLNFSWTSLIGIYGLWVLLSAEGGREFSRAR
jgi:hypothetical protein